MSIETHRNNRDVIVSLPTLAGVPVCYVVWCGVCVLEQCEAMTSKVVGFRSVRVNACCLAVTSKFICYLCA